MTDPPSGWPYQPISDSGAAGGVTYTLSYPVVCPNHSFIGCEHSFYCPNCGYGLTTEPDPCQIRYVRPE